MWRTTSVFPDRFNLCNLYITLTTSYVTIVLLYLRAHFLSFTLLLLLRLLALKFAISQNSYAHLVLVSFLRILRVPNSYKKSGRACSKE